MFGDLWSVTWFYADSNWICFCNGILELIEQLIVKLEDIVINIEDLGINYNEIQRPAPHNTPIGPIPALDPINLPGYPHVKGGNGQVPPAPPNSPNPNW